MHSGRRVVAILFAFAALAPLIVPRLAMPSFGGGDASVGGLQASYSYGELSVVDHLRGIALALAVALAAAALWAARDRVLVTAGVIVGVAGLALTPIAVALARPDVISPATDRALRVGMTRAQVEAMAGRPGGRGSAVRERSGERLACLVYLRAAADRRVLCFEGDRLVAKL